MAGISRITALEIFTQPDDLEFSLIQRDGKWGILITRGPGHNFKLVLGSMLVIESKEAAMQIIDGVLEGVCRDCGSELTDPSSIAAQVVNPEKQPLKDAHVLTDDHKAWILQELNQHNVASTYKRVSVAS